jgi:uncharacterized RDD family membrane protein YckC
VGGRDAEGHYAGIVSRSAALAIDVTLVTLFLTLSMWIVTSFLAFFRIDVRSCPLLGPGVGLRAYLCHGFSYVLLAVGIGFAPAYALAFWMLAGQTIGKAFMGVRIVRLDGRPLSFLTGVRRLFGYLLDVITLGVGFLWVLADDRRQGLHDKVAGTCVIYSGRTRRGEPLWNRLTQAAEEGTSVGSSASVIPTSQPADGRLAPEHEPSG